MIKITDGNAREIEFKSFTFKGGEESVKLNTPPDIKKAWIRADLFSSSDIMQLLMVTDALRRRGAETITLECPYFPYARQDRVMVPGEALSVKVMADLINSQNYNKVIIWDAHSDVTPALINRVQNNPQDYFVHSFIKDNFFTYDNTFLVAPDAGAIKKVSKLSELSGIQMVRADKLRDVKTGQIKETIVYSEHVGDKDFLIVDDICDGGRTFIELADKLRLLTTGCIYLHVTHGIFSNDLKVFEGKIDGISCANVFPNVSWKGYHGKLFFPN